MGKNLKIKKKNVKSSSIKAKTGYNVRRKTALKNKIEFSRKKEHSLIADTKPQVDQTKGKMEAKFNKPFFI